MWLDEHTSVSDVLKVVADAKSKYESRRNWSKSKGGNTLSEFSSRVVYYSSVLDVLAQHHPEYVALAWGAMKFLFVVTLNHEELVTQIAHAFSEIGGLLPQIEMLAKLYPVEQIRVAAANLYAQILRFCVKATKWYKRNKFMHAVTAITKPYALEFKDVTTEIELHSRKLLNLASMACCAELRDMHVELTQVRRNTYARLAFGKSPLSRKIQPSELTLETQATRPQPDHIIGGNVTRPTVPFRLENTVQYLSSNMPEPEESLRIGGIMRDRRRARGASGRSSLWLSTVLQKWASDPASSLLQVKGSVVTRDDSKDFALDLIRLAQSTNLPVVWAFGASTSSSSASISATDILKSLIQQVLYQRSETFASDSSLSEEYFRRCTTVDDWLKLLITVMSATPRILIVLDANEHMAQAISELGQCWPELMTPNIRTVVKVMIVTYEGAGCALLPSSYSSVSDATCFNLSLDEGRRPGMGRRVSPAARRALHGSRAAQDAGPEQLRRSLLKLLAVAGDVSAE